MSKETPSAHAQRDHTREEVLRIFKHCDLNMDGKLQTHELMSIFQTLGMTDTIVSKLMADADINMDGTIDVEEFLNWVWEGPGTCQETLMSQAAEMAPAAAENGLCEVSVLTLTGEEVARLTTSCLDTIADLTVKIKEAGGPHPSLQQLVFEDAVLADDTLLSSLCAQQECVAAQQMTLQLVRLPRQPLLLADFTEFVSAKYSSREQLVRELETLFEGRMVDGQIRDGDREDSDSEEYGGSDGERSFVPEDTGDELKKYGRARGTPLLCLAYQAAPLDQLASIASWLLATGASIHARQPAYTEYDDTHSVIETYFRLQKASLIQAVLDAGLEIPLSLSFIWPALPRDSRFKPEFTLPYSRSDWDFSDRIEELKRTIDTTKELVDFIAMLRCKFLPALDLPAGMLAQPLPKQDGRSHTELCDDRPLLCEVFEEGDHIWALAELLRRGIQWEAGLPDPPDLDEGMVRGDCPRRDELLRIADELEASCSHVAASLSLAIWQNDVAKVRMLLEEEHIIDGWAAHSDNDCVSLILLTIRAEACREIVDAILDDPRVDPNLGKYDYGWHGSFQLWSALGAIADEFLCWGSPRAGADLDSIDYVVTRLVNDPRSDLDFGKLQRGERPEDFGRKACGIGSLLQTDLWAMRGGYFGMLALLRAGAPLPVGVADPRIATNGGQWGYSIAARGTRSSTDETFQQFWFRRVVEGLENFLEDFEEEDEGVIIHTYGRFDPADLRNELALARSAIEAGAEDEVDMIKKMQESSVGLQLCVNKAAADELLPLLKRVMAGFRVEELRAFPISDKLTARALSRWRGSNAGLKSDTEAEQRLPKRALQEVLSFLPLWASDWCRADHTIGLILGCVDVYGFQSGSGTPLRSTDIKFQARIKVLSEWWNGK